MSKTTTATTTGTIAAPQYYELKHHMGGKSGGAELWRPGDRVTAAQLMPGLDPDFIATRIPELIVLGAIVAVAGPAPTS